MTDDANAQALFETWRKQVEDGMQAWARTVAGAPAAPTIDPSAFWRPLTEPVTAAWSALAAQGPVTPEVLARWKELLDQSIAAWSAALERAMGTEAFATALGAYVDRWLAHGAMVRTPAQQSMEGVLAALGVPSRAQLAAVVRAQAQIEELVAGVDERVRALSRQMDALFAALAERERHASRPPAASEAP